jgi:Putative Actinobacterial Holin-X, holin superfamily III
MAQTDGHLRTYTNPDDASVGQLTARLSEQVSRLVRDELALAQLEAKSKAKRLGIGAGLFGMSGVFALLGAMAGVAAAILGLALVFSPWLAALLVAGALFLAAGFALVVGALGMKRAAPPVPTEAMQSAKEDVATVRRAVKR